MSDRTEPATFEVAMEDLEGCVARLESGELTLEESLKIFERGIAASRACSGLLDQSRKRVQVLVEKVGGEFQLEFLDASDEDALSSGADE
ncbi:MAG: exodeoxyribonuclease VII small subunit [Rhodospirillaceae bacterium]|jgi:exodeoxyribonuclease VII small subunit|nr:exodeoxyribonuclease VII small subunit [Rhodospirillaceae bacterium]